MQYYIVYYSLICGEKNFLQLGYFKYVLYGVEFLKGGELITVMEICILLGIVNLKC